MATDPNEPGNLDPGQIKRIFDDAVLEFNRLARAGKAPDPVTWVEGFHPAVRPKLLAFLAGRARQAGAAASPSQLPAELLVPLGAFEIERNPDGTEVELGRGGMGVVVAARDRVLGRRVAIKFIRDRHRIDPGSLDRFWAEACRQGKLQHSGVAAAYQFGNDPHRGPFIVMEPVRGQTLAKILRSTSGRPGVDALLDVYLKVCRAAAAAHANGVAHRDLTPRNIMVDRADDEVRVLDWGIGKSGASPELTPGRADPGGTPPGATVAGWGVPAYMAPEQANGTVGADGLRVDVFMLGAVLTELLTGEPPYTGASPEAVLAAARAWDLSPARRRLGARRSRHPQLVDLALRCMSREPADRPADAGAVAMAVTDYREYVLAAATARQRRLTMLKVMAGLAPVFLCLLIAAAVGFSRATAREQGERIANTALQQRLGQVEKGNAALVSMFKALNPRGAEGGSRPLPEVLAGWVKAATDTLQGDAIGDPLAVAALQATVGQTLVELGQPNQAAGLLTQAHRTQAAGLGADHADTLTTQDKLAVALRAAGRSDEAIALFERVREARERISPPDHPDTLTTLNNLAVAYQHAGRVPEAIALHERVRDVRVKVPGPTAPITLVTLHNLATAYQAAGRLPDAVRLFEQVRAARETALDPGHPDLLGTLHNLADAYRDTGRRAEALALYERVRYGREAVLGARHPLTLATLHNLGEEYREAARPLEAITILERVSAARMKAPGLEHPDTLLTRQTLGRALVEAGRAREAVTLLEQVCDVRAKKSDPEHPHTLAALNNLACAYLAEGRASKAVELHEQVRDVRMKVLVPDHPDTHMTLHNLAEAYQDAGRNPEALKLHEAVLTTRKRVLKPDHPDTLTSMSGLATAYLTAGRVKLAVQLHEQTLELRRARLGPYHPATLNSMNNLARAYQVDNRLGGAIPLFEEVLTLSRVRLGSDHPDTTVRMNNLGSAYRASGRQDRAIPLFEEALKWRRANPNLAPDHRATLHAMSNLASAWRETGKPDQAVALFEEALKLMTAGTSLGPGHPDTLSCANGLGLAYLKVGRADEAVRLFEDVLKRRRANPGLGSAHPDTLVSMNNLAAAYRAIGRAGDAVRLSEENLAGRRAHPALGPAHPLTIDGMNSLAVTYLAAGRYDRALPVFKDYLAAQHAKLGAADPRFTNVLTGVARELMSHRRAADAELVLREYLTARERQEPDDAWTAFALRSQLGGSLLAQGKAVEAEPLLRDGYGGLKQRAAKIPPDGRPHLLAAVDRLVTLCESTDRPDEAARWRAERARYLPDDIPPPRPVGPKKPS